MARPEEWAALRAIRLRALADAPRAFAATLEQEQAKPEAEWRERAASPGSFVAVTPEGTWVGMAKVFLEPERPDEAHLVGMWVDPGFRGRGIGRGLVSAAVDWARAHGAGEIHLWVSELNEPARALYATMGFGPTGARQPLPSHPSIPEVMLSRDLTGA